MTRFIFPLLFFALPLTSLYAQGDPAETIRLINRQLDDKERQIEKRDKQIVGLKSENRRLQARINSLLTDGKSNDRKLAKALTDYYETAELLKQREKELASVQLNYQDLFLENQQYTNLNKQLADRLAAVGQQMQQQTTNVVNYNDNRVTYETRIEVTLKNDNKYYLVGPAKEKGRRRAKTTGSSSSSYRNSNDAYFGFGLGAGTNYGGAGLAIQTRLGGNVGVGFHLGGGYDPLQSINVGAGLKFFYHKGLFIDVEYMRNVQSYEENTYQDFYSATTGWDKFFGKNVGINIGVGGVFYPNDLDQEISLAFNLALLFRFRN